jgi:hypothetical protein
MMNKKILVGIAVFVTASVATFNVNLNSQTGKAVTDISLANVKALADGENGTTVGTCYLQVNSGMSYDWKMFCDSKTDNSTIYPCPTQTTHGNYSTISQDRCTK